MDQTAHGEGADVWKRYWDSREITDAYRASRQLALTFNRRKAVEQKITDPLVRKMPRVVAPVKPQTTLH
jgi:hypothetical protein